MVVIQGQNKNKDIEAIYPLCSMQQGMLFHTLYQPESRIYFEQFRFTLYGELNQSAFEQAWQLVVQRHPALRTLFVWKNRKQPVQIVRKQVILPWINLDLRLFSTEEQQTQIDSFLNTDKAQSFELDKSPLMRFVLFRLGDEAYHFVWSFHHILVDGWSWPILFKEIFAFYDSITNNQQLYLAPSRPYRDYINWLQQQDLSSAEAFWRRNLEGFTAPTPLVVEQALGQNPQHEQTSYIRHQHLSAEATATLKSFAQQHHLTVSTLIQAAWALLLSRYSGESDVVFGATVSGRPHNLSGVESMVGLFINTLPVRVKIPETTNLLPWLVQLQEEHIEREQYSYSSLVDIQGVSEIPRNQPLFESILVFENYPVNTTLQALPGNLSIGDRQALGETNYPLTVVAIPGDQLVIKINYNRDRFDADTIDRMIGHLLTLLQGLMTNSNHRPGELPLLTPAEQNLLLVEWNATQAAHPINHCIHQLFEQQVEKTPDAVAVVYENQQFTYRELNQRANQLAYYLQSLGVKPDAPVGICLERSLEAAVAILGTLKAGGACVPLDPTYPPERLAFMLADTGATVVLTQAGLKSLLDQDFHHNLILLDQGWDEIAQESNINPQIETEAQNLAYVIYTSGSTGTPKGTLVPHRSLTNLIEHHQDKMTTGVGVLQFASLSFDVSYHEMFAAWALGGTLYMIPEGDRQDLDKLIQLLAQEPIAKVFLPVTLWQQLAEIYGEEEHLFQNIREAIACGEQLQITQPMIQLFQRLENCTLYNLYGPTEADLVTSYRFSDQPQDWPIYPPIGKPAVNVQVYLLDQKYRQPVPIGVPGELYISGDGLARGYLNRPDLTEQKFVPNFLQNLTSSHQTPLSLAKGGTQGNRLYKTGDLAKYLPDGNIEFLGRIDDLVKVRGFRVELGEVEAVLSKHPQINQAVAKVHGQSAREKYLVAYFVPIQGQTITVENLRNFLQDQLPDYMIPSAFVQMESFPLTANGKVNRRALSEPTTSRPELAQTFVAPRTPTEEILAGIWRDVLGLEQIGIYDNFFNLGGHSLLATQVISLTRKAFKIELALRSLFEFPAIASLAKIVETTTRQELSPEIIPCKTVRDQHGVMPISLTQLEFWFFEQFYPGNPVYNLPLVYRVTGELNAKALEQSLREIVRRHETLRSTFKLENGQVVYGISPEPVFDFTLVDSENISETEAKQQAEKEIKQPFDLARGPLLRSKVWRLSETEHLLVVTTHHIVADGWSFSVLTQELATLYEAFAQSKPSPLTDLPIQYADFAHWQRQWLQGKVLESQMQFWKQHLGVTPPVLKLPTDYQRPPERTFTGARQPLVISPDITKALKALSQQEGVTLFMTLLAAFKTLLFCYTGQPEIIVSSTVANRTRVETEGLIGFFVHLLPFCTNLEGNPSFRELLRRVREVALGVYAHQEMPFIKLLEELQPVRDSSYTLLAQVMFVFQNTPEADLKLADLTLQEEFIATDTKDTAEFDLNLTLQETSAGIEGALVYRTDLFADSTITRMVTILEKLLEYIVTNTDKRINELPYLSERKNLPIPNSQLPIASQTDQSNFLEPSNFTEEIILTIWKEILEIEHINTQDNFFEIGGNSALVLQLLSKLEKTLKIQLPLITLFKKPTIVEQAETIQDLLTSL
ncbi:non-ribosomal peptide synthetase [Nodularia sphaerocarpa]|uniref:non-ribosomal peptide synthetase n=1 Tax=Nodularia sphaerocarpa TaxID=137816 RepID=UPI001EFA504C|nr:non-ribosomal peptide synthetase [Nodularia sphaerocarpa]MDB9373588.1 amino acid adenylation domain-containing protein [Nodularia sphaerocarpa CS-585]MDB9378027.1 amino acid adenylation domain-containing protein [Nodularia sphaerocarpa CS-585A2]ULP74376.1 non-ribosomal peptide synthetase [Nodularia sphaerocarpa UHCC 0038]